MVDMGTEKINSTNKINLSMSAQNMGVRSEGRYIKILHCSYRSLNICHDVFCSHGDRCLMATD